MSVHLLLRRKQAEGFAAVERRHAHVVGEVILRVHHLHRLWRRRGRQAEERRTRTSVRSWKVTNICSESDWNRSSSFMQVDRDKPRACPLIMGTKSQNTEEDGEPTCPHPHYLLQKHHREHPDKRHPVWVHPNANCTSGWCGGRCPSRPHHGLFSPLASGRRSPSIRAGSPGLQTLDPPHRPLI